jgi:CheY-like chemotaxis protein
MGGDTCVTSTLGGGSTFSFTAEFGIGEERDIEGPPGPGPLDRLDDLPVLLVLQRPTTRRLFERTLSGWGMRPTCAEDVSAALVRVHQAAAENRPFRLLIADASLGPPDGFALAEWLENSQVLAGPVILLISAAERSSQRERCAAVGARYLEKPVAPSDLQEAILAALDDESVRPEESSAARIAPAARSFHVLLVEDTPANQKLVTYLLKARGHVVELAADGLEALDRVRRRDYDVVLMDLQMPRMDGVAATAAIRALAAPRAAKVPIIAMTAHALRGDAEYCLAAGMNDYISKPIEGEELIALVEKWGDTHWHAATKPAPLRPPKPLKGDDPVVVGDASPGAPIFDRDEALRTCYGKLHLLRKVVTAYFEEAGPLMARIREGAARHDTADLGHAAHQLKNLLLYLGAPRVTNLVQRLERAARAAGLAGIGGDIDQLAAALAELEDELSELRE